MTLPAKSCGRKWIHESHNWKQPAIDVDWDNLPKFNCIGVNKGPTEHEFLAGIRDQVNTEEASSDALRRYAGIVVKIEEFINNEDNQIIMEEHRYDADGIALVHAESIMRIIHPED